MRESLRLVQVAMVLMIVAAALTIVTYGAFGAFGLAEAIGRRSPLGRSMGTLNGITVDLLLSPAIWLLVTVAVVRLRGVEVGRGGRGPRVFRAVVGGVLIFNLALVAKDVCRRLDRLTDWIDLGFGAVTVARFDVAIVVALVAVLAMMDRRLDGRLAWQQYALMVSIAAVAGWVLADMHRATWFLRDAKFNEILDVIDRAVPVVLVFVLGLAAARVNRGIGDRLVTRRVLRLTLVLATVLALCALVIVIVRHSVGPRMALMTLEFSDYRPVLHLLFAVWMLVVLRGSLRRVIIPGRCANCGYDVSATPGDRCPECGGDPRPVHERGGSARS